MLYNTRYDLLKDMLCYANLIIANTLVLGVSAKL